jgi:sugar O-acyltransferase (sialic acid O-acetyltransferase NeuD family)
VKSLILVGGGGHCKSCIDVIEQNGGFRIEGIVDIPDKLHEAVLGYEVIASDKDISDLVKEYEYFLITIGQIKSPDKRIELYQILKGASGQLPVIVSPLAYVSSHSQIAEGTIVMHQAMVNAGAQIGKNCIINSGALIEHDATIGDHCHISTKSVINGGSRVGMGTFFGSNSVCKEEIEIGENSIIGCGVNVLADQPNTFRK